MAIMGAIWEAWLTEWSQRQERGDKWEEEGAGHIYASGGKMSFYVKNLKKDMQM